MHAFLDGRDTPPQSAKGYLAEVQGHMDRLGVGRFGVICGRYYAMDRDTRWDRVKLAYDALVYGEGFFAADAQAAVEAAYRRGETDEFVRPTIVAPEHRAACQRRRRLPVLQLPPRPRPRAHARLLREGLRRSSTAARTRRPSTSSR